ncbi:putative sodium/calcium exchanger family protein [Zea mays]|jgi:solute carrier family 24 (sodium/potassium/calcium exchanger), member 6|uniref:Cation/calcium exchanger 2 n=2 Tax=Zea mays TaxID=4577 RepID=C0PDK2_MAIZE|nr:putative sodium/calcium exchanger family protein [Zea mays]ACN33268.1 unknown [Zea mays]ONM07662.1 Cation/calcium exchanger 2 [Zea mays]|eukprot:NP_001145820.1 putative sodium/calcium exchanger family protein [Zea mays]
MALARGRLRARTAHAVASACFLVLLLLLLTSSSLFAPIGRSRAAEPDEGGTTVLGAAPSSSSSSFSSSSLFGKGRGSSCEELQSISGGEGRCAYLRAHSPCSPAGYVDYLRLFYCGFAGAPAAAACAALALWLVVLFYLLGDTASEYFCASLEGLSAALRLPPAVAGVTLLSLGNGAPDVFASVVSFASGDGGGAGVGVGLSSALGGALFVSTVVAGAVALAAVGARGGVVVEWRGFVRDICFLLLALCYLLAVLVSGETTVWVAASFVSLYAGYVVLVWTSHCCAEKGKPAAAAGLSAPLLHDDDDDGGGPSLPSHSSKTEGTSRARAMLHCVAGALCMPLYLPRRLTIPDIAGHRWSRPYAVASAALAPVLLAFTWTSQRHNPLSSHSLAVLAGGALLGLLLAALAAATTDARSPPRGRRRRVPWLAAGFVMSVLWAYTLARELVALLVAIGYVVGIKPSVLGVTVLAWGDSLGDLVSNVAMAVHGGPGGAQTAVSGCYAGPLFNTVVGLGLSLALAAGAQHPAPFAVPADAAAYEAVGFLGAALAWALFVVPVRGMRIDRVYGVGLIAIYLCFFAVRVLETLGLWS